MVRRHPAHTRAGAMPPLLRDQKALAHQIERPGFPTRVHKTCVVHQGLNAGHAIGFVRPRGIRGDLLGTLQGLLRQVQLLGRIERQVREPVVKGHAQRGRRHAQRPGRQLGMRPAVQARTGQMGQVRSEVRGKVFHPSMLGTDATPRH